jgi:hypothetical protein
MFAAGMALALRDLDGLTVERVEDSCRPPVVALFRLMFFGSFAGMRTWTVGHTEREREFGLADQMPSARNPHFARCFTALQTPNQFSIYRARPARRTQN